MQRRQFITLLGGATAAWPLAAGAQSERLRRVGILMPYPESDTEAQMRVRAFKQELQRLAWIEGSKVQFDERWTTDNMDLVRANAASLLELKPDVIVAVGNRVIPILKQKTREVPIIIAGAVDPVGAGGQQPIVARAMTIEDIETAFATFINERADALLLISSPLFTSRRDQIVALAARYAMPASYSLREFAVAGGLISYGASIRMRIGKPVSMSVKSSKGSNLPICQ